MTRMRWKKTKKIKFFRQIEKVFQLLWVIISLVGITLEDVRRLWEYLWKDGAI